MTEETLPPGLRSEGKVLLICLVNYSCSHSSSLGHGRNKVSVVWLLLHCAQGEKGEPGLIIGPDGNLLHLEGLTGLKVSLTSFDSVHLPHVSLALT